MTGLQEVPSDRRATAVADVATEPRENSEIVAWKERSAREAEPGVVGEVVAELLAGDLFYHILDF